MPDRTQTLPVELDRDAIGVLLFVTEYTDTAIMDRARGALKAALSQPEQGHTCDPKHPCEPNDHLCRNHPSSQPEHQGDESWGPVTVRRDGDGKLHLESPFRLLSSFDDPAEEFWPASVARFQGESAEHWHEAATYWQEQTEKARQAQPTAPVLSEERLNEIAERLEAMQGRQSSGDPHTRGWLQGEAHEIAKLVRSLVSQEHREEERLVQRLQEPADGHDFELGERCAVGKWTEAGGWERCTLPPGHECNHSMQPESDQPPAPLLDEEREHLLEIARDLELGKQGYERHAAFLRNLASQEHRDLYICECCGKHTGGILCADCQRADDSREHRGEDWKPEEELEAEIEALKEKLRRVDEARKNLIREKDLGQWLEGQIAEIESAGELERLREPSDDLIRDLAHRLEDGSGSDLTYDEAAQWAISILKWLADELRVSPPSDSLGDQERCKRCGDTKVLVPLDASLPSRPCPDCNPAPTKIKCGECPRGEMVLSPERVYECNVCPARMSLETYERSRQPNPAPTRWKVGQRLRHPIGSEWELVEHVGGVGDDWRARCVRAQLNGSEFGQDRVFHREYMDRTFEVAPDPAPTQVEDRCRSALRAIRGPEDSGPWITIYREAGGGYAGLQAIAEAALAEEPR